MLPVFRAETRVAFCPGRLVRAADAVPVTDDAVSQLRGLERPGRTAVILSNHFVRYAVLPWSPALRSEKDWLAFAQHTFSSVYGAPASGWDVRVSDGGRRKARLASAVDRELVKSLRAVPGVASIQPLLMAAFNLRRPRLKPRPAWFVVQEAGRLTLALLSQDSWCLVRNRQAGDGWPARLPDLLDREHAALGEPPCGTVFVFSEDEPPSRAGRYRIVDVTAARGGQAGLQRSAVLVQ